MFETQLSGRMTRKHNGTAPQTRQALLEAAGAVFAERGYRCTTVRQICRQAGANVAAVNYHSGGKEALYREVIRHAHGRAAAKFPPDFDLGPGAAPEDQLRAFVRSFLLRIFDTGPTAWMSKLIAMEMIDPGVALDSLVRERVRPMAERLGRIVRALLGPDAAPERARLCGFSVISQCIFYAHCRAVLPRLYAGWKTGPADVERLAEHIARFSLAALREEAQAGAGAQTPRPRRARARVPRGNAPARAPLAAAHSQNTPTLPQKPTL